MNVLLISTYEMGRQSFGLASPAAWLRETGAVVTCVDVTRQKFPEAKITFVFSIKSETYNQWDFQSQKVNRQNIDWKVNVQVNLVYNETNKDYDIYMNFPCGKYNSPLLNFQELDCFYDALKRIKADLNNLLTTSNFS